MVGRKTFQFPEACLPVETLISQRGRAATTPEELTEKWDACLSLCPSFFCQQISH
jgi:hypothetical protein